MADENRRAAIAILRALKGYDLNIHICFRQWGISNGIIFGKYFKHPPLYYDPKTKDDFISSLILIQKKIGNYTLLNIYCEILLEWAVLEKAYLLQNGIIVPTVDFEKFILIFDKENFLNLCKQYSINVPAKGQYITSKFQQKFVIGPKIPVNSPYVLKRPLPIENKKSFALLSKMELDLDKHFVLEYITGPSIYYCAYYKSGEKKLSFTQINLHQQPNGYSIIKAASYELPSFIISKIDIMFGSIEWDGVVMVEMKKAMTSGTYYAIEATSRFWGTLQLSIDNGVNFPAALLGLNIHDCLPEHDMGYIWYNGYLKGIFLKMKTKSNFKKYNINSGEIIYHDVWFRKDSIFHFFAEPIIFIFITLKGWFKSK